MKILIVVPSLSLGGAERVASVLSTEFSRMGHIVKIILFDNKVEYRYSGELICINSPPSSCKFIKIFRFFQRILLLRKIFKSEKPDRIFSFMESANIPSALSGYPVVVSLRNNPERKHTFYERFLIRYVYKLKNVKKVVVVSRRLEELLQIRYGIKKTVTIYNPIFLERSSVISEDLRGYQPYILSVGRLHYQKNFDLLIKAFARSKASKEARLIIVGDGPLKSYLNRLVSELGLHGRVHLVGKKYNIGDYYAQASMFVLSSRFEGFPNVLIEALYYGLPVISTDCPFGPREIINQGFNGLLVENENERAMSEAIDRLYYDVELQNRFKINARKSVEHLSPEKIARKWLEIC